MESTTHVDANDFKAYPDGKVTYQDRLVGWACGAEFIPLYFSKYSGESGQLPLVVHEYVESSSGKFCNSSEVMVDGKPLGDGLNCKLQLEEFQQYWTIAPGRDDVTFEFRGSAQILDQKNLNSNYGRLLADIVRVRDSVKNGRELGWADPAIKKTLSALYNDLDSIRYDLWERQSGKPIDHNYAYHSAKGARTSAHSFISYLDDSQNFDPKHHMHGERQNLKIAVQSLIEPADAGYLDEYHPESASAFSNPKINRNAGAGGPKPPIWEFRIYIPRPRDSAEFLIAKAKEEILHTKEILRDKAPSQGIYEEGFKQILDLLSNALDLKVAMFKSGTDEKNREYEEVVNRANRKLKKLHDRVFSDQNAYFAEISVNFTPDKIVKLQYHMDAVKYANEFRKAVDLLFLGG
ncbi:hypothetical protein [Streptomyces sp. NBC_01264]|uniref:hypothetical protein n=1 Tax=Streptomyces sp. NBC_01264 TaxID=2903804 RepID=UPI002251DE74|nr:hypothetical protein [Streptomyces sp. NBC_01264]MCX4784168.1 hypothetical protein [Streptomyces sp. NBC_01264]